METQQEIVVTRDAGAGGPGTESGETPKPARRRSRSRRAQAQTGCSGNERGSVGQQIYAEVNRIIDAEGISKQDAFTRVGEAQGRQTGTVAANYYRVARAEGGGRVASRSRRRLARRSRGGSDASAAVKALRGALDDLGRAIREQDRVIARLQEENAQFGELRSLIARTSASARRGSRRR